MTNWVDMVDEFVRLLVTSSTPLLSEDQSQLELSLDNWEQNIVHLWGKCSQSFDDVHLATIIKHIYFGAFGLATMFKVYFFNTSIKNKLTSVYLQGAQYAVTNGGDVLGLQELKTLLRLEFSYFISKPFLKYFLAQLQILILLL